LTWYGKSKLAAETRVRDWGEQNGENFVILRPSAVYGPRDRDMLVYFRLIKKGLFILPVEAENRFSLLHVADLVDAVIRAAQYPAHGETYFVSGDEACTWERFGNAIKSALNKAHPLKVVLPPFTQHVGPLVCDLISHLRGKPLFMSRQKMLELKQPAWLCSNRKIKARLQWAPRIPLEKGIKETVRWYMEENWL
jgi:nucleoside-diphosphate-sugar epimerase